jgi:Mor family transcriptional regulator
MSNIKIKGWDITGMKFKRFFGWTIKELAKRYNVTTRTVYRTLKK